MAIAIAPFSNKTTGSTQPASEMMAVVAMAQQTAVAVNNITAPTIQPLTEAADIAFAYNGRPASVPLNANRNITITNMPAGSVVFDFLLVVHNVAGTVISNLPGDSSQVAWNTGIGVTRLDFFWDGATFYWGSNVKGTPVIISSGILSNGVWNDGGTWDDTANWKDN